MHVVIAVTKPRYKPKICPVTSFQSHTAFYICLLFCSYFAPDPSCLFCLFLNPIPRNFRHEPLLALHPQSLKLFDPCGEVFGWARDWDSDPNEPQACRKSGREECGRRRGDCNWFTGVLPDGTVRENEKGNGVEREEDFSGWVGEKVHEIERERKGQGLKMRGTAMTSRPVSEKILGISVHRFTRTAKKASCITSKKGTNPRHLYHVYTRLLTEVEIF